LQALALRVGVRDLASGLGLVDRVREDSVDQDLEVLEQFHLRVKLLVRSVLRDARAVEASSIRRRRKAQ
jgi:hypothetical protein